MATHLKDPKGKSLADCIVLDDEEEENSIIMELRKNCASLQEKFTKEEADKLAAMDSIAKEREARLDIEKYHIALSKELAEAQRVLLSSNQEISSLNDMHKGLSDMYKGLLDHCTSLEQYKGKLRTDLSIAENKLKHIEEEKAALRGQLKAIKQKDEIAFLRAELHQVKDNRDRLQPQVQTSTTDEDEDEDYSEKYWVFLIEEVKKLEANCSSQNNQIRILQKQLAIAEEKLLLRDSSALETRAEFEGQKKLINELENRLADAEFRIVEEERLRKKLHKTILELNGNIRVFCRVRPLLPDDGGSSTEGKVIYYPESIEMVGRGIDVVQCGQKHTFTFDQVFMPDATQDDVFVEISELVQSAMDGHKVCIFAYGQTGSGKTYTMMGRRGHPEHKGLIPRSLEQIFQTRQSLQPHGWRYEMQVSMMEIYNETIRDLLSTNPSSAIKKGANTDRAAGKQYAIRHDANGNVHVSDLTIVDVHSAEEVALLLYRAAQSRSVGKTRMNEQSSRSHFVFTLRIFGVHESTKQQVQGVLNLIDLAGSGRLSKSGATGDRMKETQAINKSLSSLNDVILALAKKEGHIPFRNSKLTCLLQPCLGGESKTLMFVNISPDLSSVGESLCSLRFAARVNSFEIGIRRRQTNIGPSDSRG